MASRAGGSVVHQILDAKGAVVGREPSTDAATRLRIYRTMQLARRIDEACMKLQRQGRIGFYGRCTGEEAAAVGAAAALRPDDWVFPALRQAAVMLYRGWPTAMYFHHLFGTALSVERGRSMPCHYSDREVHQVAWSSCMATQLPHAVGMAYAARYLQRDVVAAGFLGDGATSEGDFHCALNLAAVWKAPVVFVCNNNQWAISVPFSSQTASDGVAVKASAYGFPGVRIDGNDALAVFDATRQGAERARRGEGPTLIEAVTYRIEGHSSSDDPTRYRPDAEVEAWKAKDPIARFRQYLIDRGEWSAGDDAPLVEELDAEVRAAIAAAEAAPAPTPDTLVREVFSDVPWHLQEQFDDIRRFVP